MPNWCNNTLTLNEDSNNSILQVLKDYFTDVPVEIDPETKAVLKTETILDLEKMVPYPKCIKETLHLWNVDNKHTPEERTKLIEEAKETNLKECGYDSFYDWCIDHWGTKWNTDSMQTSESGISFVSAWSPPVKAIAKLAKQIKQDLRLTYIEEGMGFCGEFFAYANGTWVDNEYDIKDAPQALLDELGYEPYDEEE
jgi:hypothetical protein